MLLSSVEKALQEERLNSTFGPQKRLLSIGTQTLVKYFELKTVKSQRQRLTRKLISKTPTYRVLENGGNFKIQAPLDKFLGFEMGERDENENFSFKTNKREVKYEVGEQVWSFP